MTATDDGLRADGGRRLPAWAELTDGGRIRCTRCGNEADELPVEHDCIYANDLVADGGLGPVCEECGEVLEVDEEWKLAPGLTPGSEADESTNYGERDGSGYVHERCLEPGSDDTGDGGSRIADNTAQ